MYALGWWMLVLVTSAISAWSIRLYFKDKDKRKLMFSIIFFLSNFIFLFNALNIRLHFQNTLFVENLFQWFTLPVMTALLIAVVESFISSKDFKKGFFTFFIFSTLTFGFVFLPFQISGFLGYVRMSIALGVISFSLYQLIKWKNIQSVFFLAAVGSFSVAGMAHAYQQFGLSIFAYAIAYLFLGLVFAWYASNTPMTNKGMGSYFSLQKKLDDTKYELNQSKELYKSIVENTQDVIILTESNGENSYVSPSSTHVLGYSPAELKKRNPWPLKIHPDDKQMVQNAIKKGYAGYPGSNFQYRIFTKNGDLRWISHSWSPIKENRKIEKIVSSIKDITDLKITQQKLADRIDHLQKNELATLNIMEDFQESISSLKKARHEIDKKNVQLKESQEKLKKFNEDLEQRVHERTKEVERLLKQKDAFIDQLGHDLKHPLGPFINLIPLLKKRETDEKKREILRVLERNVDYMKRLVVRTVKLAKLNAPSTTFDFQSIHLADFIQRIIEKNKSSFEQNDVEINTMIDSDIVIDVDPLQIEEVVENLVSNSLKYGAEHGKISISAEEKQDEKIVLISIKDTGQGMTSDQLESIFNEFYKADESRHDFTSTGLGLAICKRIIEKHDGEIWAESPGIGKGTTFYFTLPMKIEKEKTENMYIDLNKNNN
ncbi:MAG: PAS domain S-box protein [Candidatus Thermoplasmatota archaeon]|nr:PAS domain S-box protein [Candidatus Thermoplasmatota archaeon]